MTTTNNYPSIPTFIPNECEEKCIISDEPRIYAVAKDTREILQEVMTTLDNFKNEIHVRDKNNSDPTFTEPRCFKDDVLQTHELALAIRGDLYRLIQEFR